MAEINIKITELNNTITKMKSLQKKSKSVNATPPVTVGGGKTVNEIEEIAKLYQKLNTHFGDLVSNTVSFLTNVKDSYSSSDLKASKGISKK